MMFDIEIESKVRQALVYPAGLGQRFLEKTPANSLIVCPVRLERAYNMIRQRSQGCTTNISGVRNAVVLTRAEENEFFSAALSARTELIALYESGKTWDEIVEDDWGGTLFHRAAYLRENLFYLNYPLMVRWWCKNVKLCAHHTTSDEEDIFSKSSIKLLDCIDLFDPHRNLKFSTYAVNALNNSIRCQSFREVNQHRNRNVISIFADDQFSHVIQIADPRSSECIIEHQESLVIWLRDNRNLLTKNSQNTIQSIIEDKPDRCSKDASSALAEVIRLMKQDKLSPIL
jgi:hypothetical protein